MASAKANSALGRPYQIYTESLDCGKNLEGSKKRIKWRFGWAADDEEHEIMLVHSLVSGKKAIFEDGVEITSSNKFFEFNYGHSWNARKANGHIFRVDANLPPFGESYYIFSIDGKRFIDLPRKQPEKRASDTVNKLSKVDTAADDDDYEERGKKKVVVAKDKQRTANNGKTSYVSSSSAKAMRSTPNSKQTDNRIKKNNSISNNNNNSKNNNADRGFFQSPVPTSNSAFDPFDQPSAEEGTEGSSNDLYGDFVNSDGRGSSTSTSTSKTNWAGTGGVATGAQDSDFATVDLLGYDSPSLKSPATAATTDMSAFADMTASTLTLTKEASRATSIDPFSLPAKAAATGKDGDKRPAAASIDPFSLPAAARTKPFEDPFAVPIKARPVAKKASLDNPDPFST